MQCGEPAILARAAIPLSVTQQRRDICRECLHATRNPDPKFVINKGLTKRSICRVVEEKNPGRANIAQGTEREDVGCPLGRWGKVISQPQQFET